MFRCSGQTVLITLSIICLMGSVLGLTMHLLFAENIVNHNVHKSKENSMRKVALITLYLQIPQHIMEVISLVLLIFGLIQSKRQFMLPWLIINAVSIGLYSTILLVMGMTLTGYLFFGYFLIGCYGYFWYQIQCRYTLLAQQGDSDSVYTLME